MAIINRIDQVKTELKRLQIVIFESRYQCQMMQRDIYDLEYINTLGMPVSDIPWVNDVMDTQWSYCLLTINQMVEYINNGVNFKLDEPKTYAGIIYKALVDYMRCYAEISERYPNFPLPDADDFVKMDTAAAKIYEVYRCFEPTEDTAGVLGRLRARRSRVIGVKPNTPVQVRDQEGNAVVKQHVSQLDSFGYRIRKRKEPNQHE